MTEPSDPPPTPQEPVDPPTGSATPAFGPPPGSDGPTAVTPPADAPTSAFGAPADAPTSAVTPPADAPTSAFGTPPDAPTSAFGAPVGGDGPTGVPGASSGGGSTRAGGFPGDPPPVAAGGGAERRLRRSTSRKVLGGVAGGLGEYTGIDPVLFRVLFAVLTLFGGTGLLLYLLGWLFLPAEDQSVSPAESVIGRGIGSDRGRDAGVAAALVVAGLFMAGVLARGDGDDVVLLVLVLLGGYFLLRNLPDRRGESPPPPPSPAPTPRPYEAAFPTGGGTATLTAPVAPPAPPPARRRERSVLGPVTVSVLLLLVGVTAALDAGGAVDPAPEDYLALSVAVLGVGLIVGAFVGRARGLFWLALPLLAALVVLGSTGVSLRGGAGDREYTPTRLVDVQDEYRLGVGSLRLDLSGIDFDGTLSRVEVSSGIGEIKIVVPADADVSVDGRAGIGDVDLFDRRMDGTSAQLTVVDRGLEGDGQLDLVLDVDVNIGNVEVTRATA